jgi:hypothetical protein
MSIRLMEGASEGCRPKLPRWPFSGSSCTRASGTAVHRSMVGNHARRVKAFAQFFSALPAFVEHHRPRASAWPCSHQYRSWNHPSRTLAHHTDCLALSRSICLHARAHLGVKIDKMGQVFLFHVFIRQRQPLPGLQRCHPWVLLSPSQARLPRVCGCGALKDLSAISFFTGLLQLVLKLSACCMRPATSPRSSSEFLLFSPLIIASAAIQIDGHESSV